MAAVQLSYESRIDWMNCIPAAAERVDTEIAAGTWKSRAYFFELRSHKRGSGSSVKLLGYFLGSSSRGRRGMHSSASSSNPEQPQLLAIS